MTETTVRVTLIELTWQRLDVRIVGGYLEEGEEEEEEESPLWRGVCYYLYPHACRHVPVGTAPPGDGALIKVGYGNENGARLGRVALEEAVLQRRGVGAGETMLHRRV